MTTYQTARERAQRIDRMVTERAFRAFSDAFGCEYVVGRDPVFLYAHNWSIGNCGLTPSQLHACRYVKHLECTKMFAGYRLLEAWTARVGHSVAFPR